MTILVSIYDKKAATYQPPMAFPSIAEVIRAYASLFLRKKDSQLVQFQEDYDLYQVGEFEERTGQVLSTIPPNFLESFTNIANTINSRNNGGRVIENEQQ